MKALCFYEHGGPEVMQIADLPEPLPGPGQVLVQIRACALNHLDIWVRQGWPGLKLELPHVPASDGAGVVAGLGDGVSGWTTGQRVVIDPGISTAEDEFTRRGEHSVSPGYYILGEQSQGLAAEYAVVPAENLLPLPDEIDFPQAAAPLLVTLTAWRMLVHRAQVRPGESVLIVGAGGGVNSMAIQICKLMGATVYALTSSEAKTAHARDLGADVVIDYRQDPQWSKTLFKLTGRRGVDVVVDNVGQATITDSMRAVARGGRIVIVGNTSGPKAEMDLRYIFGKQISLIGSTMGNHQDFRDVTALLWSGKLRPVIDRVLPLEQGCEAMALLERGEQFGKLVLTP